MKLRSFSRPLSACVLLLALSLSASARPQSGGETLRSLLAKHQRAMNVPGARPDKSAHKMVYALSAASLSGTLTIYEALPGKTREEINLGPLHMVTASNGRTSWEQDMTGAIRIVRGEELAENKADESFSIDSYDPFKQGKKAPKGRVTLRPKRDPATGCFVLDILPLGGSQQTVFLDPKTYLVRKFIERKGGLAGTISILSYQTRFGARVPSKLQIGYAGLPMTIEATLSQATGHVKLASNFFQPPQVARDFEFLGAQAPRKAVIPFRNEDNEIVVPVVINGQTLHFIVDSGAASSFITGEAAQKAGLTAQGDLPALGYGGPAQAGVAVNATMEIPGAVRLKGQPLHVVKDPQIAQSLSARGDIDGGLGYELFSRFVVSIDYGAKTLTLVDPDKVTPAAPSASTVILPIKLENHSPTILASVDGKKRARFLVDTGDSGSVHLYTRYARANGLWVDPDSPGAHTRLGVGIGGVIREAYTLGHRLGLGQATLSDVSVSTLSGSGIANLMENAGGIGNGVWKRYVVMLDYSRGQMRLTKPAQAALGKSRKFFLCAAPRLTLAQALEKHLAALGGRAALEAIKQTRVTAQVSTGGISGTVITVFAAPDKEYEEDKLGILDIAQGYDGKAAWRQDTNGTVRPLAGDELKNLRNQIFFDTYAYALPGRGVGSVSLRPQTDPITGDYLLDVFPQGGKPCTLSLDPTTFLIVREQHLEDDVPVTTTYSDYRTVDGVQFPFREYTTNGTARYDIVGTVAKIENNIALPQAFFSAPTSRSNFAFIAPAGKAATIPFEDVNGEIAFAVRLNGHPARLFLDSGTGAIALSQETAERLHLKQGGYLEVRGYGGSADLHPVQIDTLEVPGAVRLTNAAAIAVPLDELLGHSLAGLVGYDLLAHSVVRLDYGRRQITFLDANTFRPAPADGAALPLDLDNNIPSITAQMDNLPPARFLIDTGDQGTLRLYKPYVQKYGLDRKYPGGVTALGGGIGGLSESRRTRVGKFTVADVAFRGVPTDFSLDPKGGVSQVNAGSLGSGLLSRFVVTFDYPHSRVFFAPVSATDRSFDTRTFGLELIEDRDAAGERHLIVAEVQPGARAGDLQRGDEVLRFDGRPVGEIGLDGLRKLLSPANGQTMHTLVVRSKIGEPRTIHVSLFDPLR